MMPRKLPRIYSSGFDRLQSIFYLSLFTVKKLMMKANSSFIYSYILLNVNNNFNLHQTPL